ncbi:hypothetical protein DFH07DRAFT_304538 [Mycena maculata]|uniref:Uncharacterized protein n=1 Tax=Mycena maculata TaxID=230809 RepID=A0AAD7MKF7_9AGAR|nr:hypothetical protein DFH07DRAFT_304538 [Mycena maculata]
MTFAAGNCQVPPPTTLYLPRGQLPPAQDVLGHLPLLRLPHGARLFLCVRWLPIGVSRTYGFRSAKEVFTMIYNCTGAPLA